jgi:DNA-directed RNA polymerase subunit RPC12/RpoP
MKLIIGSNDLETLYPQLLDEWDYINNKLLPLYYTAGSGFKAQWICKNCQYSWKAAISDRSKKQTGCPVCFNKIIISGVNDLGTTNPELINEWHIKNNAKTFKQYSKGNPTKVWWICAACNHEYECRINHRVNGVGCPVCSGKIIKIDFNDLKTKYPTLVKEWSNKNKLNPENYTTGVNKKVWWVCKKCNHEWEAEIRHRTKGTDCPCCSRIIAIQGKNDLTITHPELINEWCYEKNNKLPQNFLSGSAHKAWWICKKCNHEWLAAIYNRALKKQNCPKCNLSHGERLIEEYLTQQNIIFAQQYINKKIKYKKYLKFDFKIEHDNQELYIEYNGKQHYSYSKWNKNYLKNIEKLQLTQLRDNIKIKKCQELQIPLLMIPYTQSDIQIKELILNFIQTKQTNIKLHLELIQ